MKKIRFLVCNLLATALCAATFCAALSACAQTPQEQPPQGTETPPLPEGPQLPDEPAEFTVTYEAGRGGFVAGATSQTIVGTDTTEEVCAVPETGYIFTRWSDGLEEPARTDTDLQADQTLTAYFEIESLGLPAIEIYTEGGTEVTSKETYTGCTVTVSGAEEKYNFTGAPAKIRGRGNSTWGMPKKPYKLKFEEKTDLFGNGKAKTWTLIANYCDPSLARNYFALSVAALFPSLSSTSTVKNVDLYLNGKYDGVYLVCEQNEVGKTRLDIDDSTESTDTGYLLEIDYAVRIEGEEGQDYFTYFDPHFKQKCYQIKSPDPEDIVKDGKYPSHFAAYIAAYVYDCMDALKCGDYEAVESLIDVESFAESYLVHELFHPHDVGESSFFLYKKAGGKLYSGPVWDFDISAGNCNYASEFAPHYSTDPNTLWAKEVNPWYCYLLQFDEFRALVGRKLAEYGDRITETIKACTDALYANEAAFKRNFKQWDILGKENWPNPPALVNIRSWKQQVNYVKGWLGKSLAYMKTQYPSDL